MIHEMWTEHQGLVRGLPLQLSCSGKENIIRDNRFQSTKNKKSSEHEVLNRASANSKPIANLHDRKVIKRQKKDAVKSFPAADAPSAKSLLQWQLQNKKKSVSCTFCFTHTKIPNDSLAQELCKRQKFRGWAEKFWAVMTCKDNCAEHRRKLDIPGAKKD